MLFKANWIKNRMLTLLIGSCALLMCVQMAAADYANPAVPGKDTADYWLDRGGLFSAYGNYQAAIHAYEKALSVDSANSEAHFGLGIAYAQIRDYTQALNHIDQAISAAPQNGRYFYGRAWVFLRAGRAAEADTDLKKASDLGQFRMPANICGVKWWPAFEAALVVYAAGEISAYRQAAPLFPAIPDILFFDCGM